MLSKYLRTGLLLATLVASLTVAAAPRYWMLTGVDFRTVYAGHATGYFSYDDATQTISNWNVQVDHFFVDIVAAFTYVPGNSTTSVIQPFGAGAPTLVFSATMGAPGPNYLERHLRLVPLTALDGSNATVPLATFSSIEEFPSLPDSRVVTAGSLTLMPAPPAVAVVQVDEFYNASLRHYFITADAAERQTLDAGVPPGWTRTGESFKAYAIGSNTSGSVNPVCRFYGPPEFCYYYNYGCERGPDSHFFSADAGECRTVFRSFGIWQLERDNAFQINLPDNASGACPVGTTPVYRLWNQRVDSNHRYTTSTAIKAQMLAAGFLAEGYGPDGVVMCAVQ